MQGKIFMWIPTEMPMKAYIRDRKSFILFVYICMKKVKVRTSWPGVKKHQIIKTSVFDRNVATLNFF